jgi:hypothetical protein
MIAFQPAETFIHSAKWCQVRLWHLADIDDVRSNVPYAGRNGPDLRRDDALITPGVFVAAVNPAKANRK